MKYILLLYADQSGFERMDEQQQTAALGQYMAYGQALREADKDRGSERPQPASTS